MCGSGPSRIFSSSSIVGLPSCRSIPHRQAMQVEPRHRAKACPSNRSVSMEYLFPSPALPRPDALTRAKGHHRSLASSSVARLMLYSCVGRMRAGRYSGCTALPLMGWKHTYEPIPFQSYVSAFHAAASGTADRIGSPRCGAGRTGDAPCPFTFGASITKPWTLRLSQLLLAYIFFIERPIFSTPEFIRRKTAMYLQRFTMTDAELKSVVAHHLGKRYPEPARRARLSHGRRPCVVLP